LANKMENEIKDDENQNGWYGRYSDSRIN
jgi:hypothetical protein